jgi:starch synthase
LAHATGGLKDTIAHNKTGFLFEGTTYEQKIEQFKCVFNEVLDIYFNQPDKWQQIRKRAGKMRFTWAKSVDRYYIDLYEGNHA